MMIDTAPSLVIGVGASAGGVPALLSLVSGIDADLPLAVLVVLHQSASAPPVLATLLGRRCAVPVAVARDREPLEPGRVFVAPPGHHMAVRGSRLVVGRGPRLKGHRPGVDLLFDSLAREWGPRAVGVILSGMLDDGAAGLLTIVRHGGSALVQAPEDALYPAMPQAALRQVPEAVVAPAPALPAMFAALADRTGFGGDRGVTRRLVHRPRPTVLDRQGAVAVDRRRAANGRGTTL